MSRSDRRCNPAPWWLAERKVGQIAGAYDPTDRPARRQLTQSSFRMLARQWRIKQADPTTTPAADVEP